MNHRKTNLDTLYTALINGFEVNIQGKTYIADDQQFVFIMAPFYDSSVAHFHANEDPAGYRYLNSDMTSKNIFSISQKLSSEEIFNLEYSLDTKKQHTGKEKTSQFTEAYRMMQNGLILKINHNHYFSDDAGQIFQIGKTSLIKDEVKNARHIKELPESIRASSDFVFNHFVNLVNNIPEEKFQLLIKDQQIPLEKNLNNQQEINPSMVM